MLTINRKKTAIALTVFVVVAATIITWGSLYIAQSDAMTIARRAVAETVGATETEIEEVVAFRWWRPWSFSESGTDGVMRFTLCATKSNLKQCFDLRMEKNGGNWSVTKLVERP